MNGWIGVDLDGTLAMYEHGTYDHRKIGEPVPLMVKRVKEWLEDGWEVRIFTARVADGDIRTHVLIEEWTRKHIGRTLEATCKKDYQMICLYDDRCVRVEQNTGRLIGAP